MAGFPKGFKVIQDAAKELASFAEARRTLPGTTVGRPLAEQIVDFNHIILSICWRSSGRRARFIGSP